MIRIEQKPPDKRPWVLKEHVTTPRPAWWQKGFTLSDPPPDLPEPPRQARSGYVSVYRPDASRAWYFQFEHQGKRHYQGGFETAEAAARAHDAYVRARGINRALLLEPGE